MRKNKVLYQLIVEDFQNVALELLDRELTDDELQRVSGWVADRIPWHDLIEEGIDELANEQREVDV